MSITIEKDCLVTGVWKQGDIRDPIGIFGGVTSITGNGDGTFIRVSMRIDSEDAFLSGLFAIYDATILQTLGSVQSVDVLYRIFSNWPNIDQQPGITPFNSGIVRNMVGSNSWVSPRAAPDAPLVQPLDRFRLIWDPRHLAPQNMLLCEWFINMPVAPVAYQFSVYGYFWDRSVLNAPGGPRHPGSS